MEALWAGTTSWFRVTLNELRQGFNLPKQTFEALHPLRIVGLGQNSEFLEILEFLFITPKYI